MDTPPLPSTGDDSPQAPVIKSSVAMFQSLGGIIDAAAQVAARVVCDLGADMEKVPPALRGDLLLLCDAVYDLDYRTPSP